MAKVFVETVAVRSWSGLRIVLFAAALAASPALRAAPDVGDRAPDFSLPGSDGTTYSLSGLRGTHVVIAFFPKAFTGG